MADASPHELEGLYLNWSSEQIARFLAPMSAEELALFAERFSTPHPSPDAGSSDFEDAFLLSQTERAIQAARDHLRLPSFAVWLEAYRSDPAVLREGLQMGAPDRPAEPWEVFVESWNSDTPAVTPGTFHGEAGGRLREALDLALRRARLHAKLAGWSVEEGVIATAHMALALSDWLRAGGQDREELRRALRHAQAMGRAEAADDSIELEAVEHHFRQRIREALEAVRRAV